MTDAWPDDPTMSVLLPVLIAIPPVLAFVFETPLLRELGALMQPRHDGSLHPIGWQAKRISSVATASLDRLLGTRSRDGSLAIANDSYSSKPRDNQSSSGGLVVAPDKRPLPRRTEAASSRVEPCPSSRLMEAASSGVELSGITLADASSELDEEGDEKVRQILDIMEKEHSMLRAAHAIRDLMKQGCVEEEQKEVWIRLREELGLTQGDWHGPTGAVRSGQVRYYHALALSRAKWKSTQPEIAAASPVAAIGSSRRERALAMLPTSQPPDSTGRRAQVHSR